MLPNENDISLITNLIYKIVSFLTDCNKKAKLPCMQSTMCCICQPVNELSQVKHQTFLLHPSTSYLRLPTQVYSTYRRYRAGYATKMRNEDSLIDERKFDVKKATKRSVSAWLIIGCKKTESPGGLVFYKFSRTKLEKRIKDKKYFRMH